MKFSFSEYLVLRKEYGEHHLILSVGKWLQVSVTSLLFLSFIPIYIEGYTGLRIAE